jgi:formyl-CoA transferase
MPKDDPRYSSNVERWKYSTDYIEPIIKNYISEHTKEEVIEQFNKFDVPVAPIYTIAEAVNDSHFTQRGMLVDVEHVEAGTMKLVGPVIKFSRTPSKVLKPGPLLGENNNEVFEGELGLSDDELNRLKAMKVI